MKIEAVHILPTKNTPEVFLNPNGIIQISGRAIDESRAKYSEQILEWIDSYIVKPAPVTQVSIALEYMNSYNSIIITSILKKLSEVNKQSKRLVIKWFIEIDDDDLMERSESISSALNLPIEFITTDQIKSHY
jgi:hypothetical protein